MGPGEHAAAHHRGLKSAMVIHVQYVQDGPFCRPQCRLTHESQGAGEGTGLTAKWKRAQRVPGSTFAPPTLDIGRTDELLIHGLVESARRARPGKSVARAMPGLAGAGPARPAGDWDMEDTRSIQCATGTQSKRQESAQSAGAEEAPTLNRATQACWACPCSPKTSWRLVNGGKGECAGGALRSGGGTWRPPLSLATLVVGITAWKHVRSRGDITLQ